MNCLKSYIFWGGEDLNDPAVFADTLSESALKLFHDFALEISGCCLDGKFSLLDISFTPSHRLVITAFKDVKKGQRTVVWYLGLIISKESYSELKSLQCLYEGIKNLKIDDIKKIVAEQNPIIINTEHSIAMSPIGMDIKDLIGFQIIKSYPDNIKELTHKLSINGIDEWFEKLFIAINPDKYKDEFTTIVAESKPKGIWKPKKDTELKEDIINITPKKETQDGEVKTIPNKKIDNAPKKDKTKAKQSNSDQPLSIYKQKNIVFAVVILFLVILNIILLVKLNKTNSDLATKKTDLKFAKKTLSKKGDKINRLNGEINKKDKLLDGKDDEIRVLKTNLKEKGRLIGELNSQIKEANSAKAKKDTFQKVIKEYEKMTGKKFNEVLQNISRNQ